MLSLLLYLLCLYLPFQIALNPTEGVDLASVRVFIVALALIWLAEGLKKKKLNLVGGLVSVFLVLFLFVSALSVSWASNIDWAVRKILFLLSIFPIYFVASDVMRSSQDTTKFLRGLSISGFLVALAGLTQFFSQFVFGLPAVYRWSASHAAIFLGQSVAESVLANPSWLVGISGRTWLRSIATFPDPHMLSLYLGMLFPLSCGLYLKTKKRWYLLASLTIFLADILTFSRGGYLGLLAGVFFLTFVFWKKIALRYKLSAAGFLVLVSLSFFIPSPVSSRFNSIFDLQEGSNVGRLDMWQKAYRVALENPFGGVGIGNYPLEIKASASYREPITAHNTYLDIASETGFVSALIWLAMIFAAIIIFWRRSKEDSFFLTPAVSLVIFATHSLAETSLYSPLVLTLFLIIFSLTHANLAQKNS